MQLPPWPQSQERSGREVLSSLLEYVNSREEWLKVALESMGAEQSYYATCHSVQNEYVQRLCEEVEQRQATAHDDGATLHDIIKYDCSCQMLEPISRTTLQHVESAH